MHPNRASGPQNQPMAKVAVSTAPGAETLADGSAAIISVCGSQDIFALLLFYNFMELGKI